MRRVLYMALYWMLSVLMLALTVSSLGYSFPEALLVGTMFLPGALAAKFLLPGISFSSRTAGIWHLLLATSAILVMDVIVNPVFVAAFVALLVIGDRFLDRYLSARCPERDAAVTFYSERKKVSLLPSEILYVESNDTEVCLYATGCRKFRNRTCISQWEALLGNGFVRIHRSYLVRRSAVEHAGPDSVTVAGIELPVSRKYRAAARTLKDG